MNPILPQGFKLYNFHFYYINTPRIMGKYPSSGTAILVNRRLIHHHVYISKTSLTNISIHIHLGNSEIRLVSTYKIPNILLQTSDLDDHLTIYTIIAGDLNAKNPSWNSRVFNTSGCILQRYLDQRLATSVAVPYSPTHYPDNTNHLPDIL